MPQLEQVSSSTNRSTDYLNEQSKSASDSQSSIAQAAHAAYSSSEQQPKAPNQSSQGDAPVASASDNTGGSKTTGSSGENQNDGPSKNVATLLDTKLRQFSDAQLTDPSASIVQFQQLVGEFESAPNKADAIQSLGTGATKLRLALASDAISADHASDAEAAKEPGRAALDADYSSKLNAFFDAVFALPEDQSGKILQLDQMQPGETKDQHDQRVRTGLQGSSLLPLFDSMETAMDKVEQMKTPAEKLDEQKVRQDDADIQTIKLVMNQAVARSQISDAPDTGSSSMDSGSQSLQPADGKAGPASIYPNSDLTPGDELSVSKEQVCTPGYAGSVRSVSEAEKKAVYKEYGIPYAPKDNEVDHFVSLELGGSNDIKNLWPEPYMPRPGAHEKDKVENYLHKEVCDGSLTLQQAQDQIKTDWYAVYQQMKSAHLADGPDGPTVE